MSKELVDKVYAEFRAEIGGESSSTIQARIDALHHEMDALQLQLANLANINNDSRQFLETLDAAFAGNAPEHVLWVNLRARFGEHKLPKLEVSQRKERLPKTPVQPEDRDKVLRVLTREPMSATDVAKALQVDTPSVSYVLSDLVATGTIKAEGSYRRKRYLLETAAEA